MGLKTKLSCNYGTAIALLSFLRKLVVEATLAPPRTGGTELLETALQRANCPALKPLFVAQGVADDVLFEIVMDALGNAHDEIADHADALEAAIQGLCSTSIVRLVISALFGEFRSFRPAHHCSC